MNKAKKRITRPRPLIWAVVFFLTAFTACGMMEGNNGGGNTQRATSSLPAHDGSMFDVVVSPCTPGDYSSFTEGEHAGAKNYTVACLDERKAQVTVKGNPRGGFNHVHAEYIIRPNGTTEQYAEYILGDIIAEKEYAEDGTTETRHTNYDLLSSGGRFIPIKAVEILYGAPRSQNTTRTFQKTENNYLCTESTSLIKRSYRENGKLFRSVALHSRGVHTNTPPGTQASALSDSGKPCPCITSPGYRGENGKERFDSAQGTAAIKDPTKAGSAENSCLLREHTEFLCESTVSMIAITGGSCPTVPLSSLPPDTVVIP